MASDLIGQRRGPAPTRAPGQGPGTRRRARVRRDLAHRDLVAARLAELHHIQDLLVAAQTAVGSGWVQRGWLVRTRAPVPTPAAGVAVVDAAEAEEVTAACLVAAVALAGGGAPGVYTQPVQRALDLVWHTLYGGPGRMAHLCPAPSTRAARNQDLVLWNDAPDRTVHDVTALLAAAGEHAGREVQRLRSL